MGFSYRRDTLGQRVARESETTPQERGAGYDLKRSIPEALQLGDTR